MEILYNVTVCIDQSVEKEWKKWMIDVHIPDVMMTELFLSYSMQRIVDSENETGVSYSIQYLASSMDAFNQYQSKYAQALQKEHTDRYKGKYASFRTLMEVVSRSK